MHGATSPHVAEGFAITPIALRRLVVGAIVLLALAGVATQLLAVVFGHDHLFGLTARFDLNGERNIPSWYSSAGLAACALLLALIAAARRDVRDPYSRHWAGLAVVFLLLSLDEAASLHEMMNAPLRARLEASGYLFFPWVLAGGTLVCAMAVAYWRFLLHLQAATRLRFLIAASVFVGGALGCEVIAAAHYEAFGKATVTHVALVAFEEVLELSGVAIFLCALFAHLHSTSGAVLVRAQSRLTRLAAARQGQSLLEITLSPRRVGRALAAAALGLTLLSVGTQALRYGAGIELGPANRFFNVALEGNLPTWFSGLLLLACAAAFLAVAGARRAVSAHEGRCWAFLGILFAYLSFDEAAAVHELAVDPMRAVIGSGGLLHHAWIVPGGAVAAAIALALRRFLAALPGHTRRAFTHAALVFLVGALGVEALGGWHSATAGRQNFGYALLTTVEEGAEMIGIVMLLVALLRYLERSVGAVWFAPPLESHLEAPASVGVRSPARIRLFGPRQPVRTTLFFLAFLFGGAAPCVAQDEVSRATEHIAADLEELAIAHGGRVVTIRPLTTVDGRTTALSGRFARALAARLKRSGIVRVEENAADAAIWGWVAESDHAVMVSTWLVSTADGRLLGSAWSRMAQGGRLRATRSTGGSQ